MRGCPLPYPAGAISIPLQRCFSSPHFEVVLVVVAVVLLLLLPLALLLSSVMKLINAFGKSNASDSNISMEVSINVPIIRSGTECCFVDMASMDEMAMGCPVPWDVADVTASEILVLPLINRGETPLSRVMATTA